MNSKIDLSNVLFGLCCGFFKGVVVVGLIIGFQWSGVWCVFVVVLLDVGFVFNVFLWIVLDDSVMVIVKYVEMGQGVYIGIVIIVVEEFDVDWSKVCVESVFVDVKCYVNLVFGIMQGIGGSLVMVNFWM